MSDPEKLNMVKSLLNLDDDSEDDRISVYLRAAQNEIVGWRYSYSERYSTEMPIPEEYEMTQIYAVIAGYSQSGAENQLSHGENGITRRFSYPDMLHYIRSNVIPIAKVM